MIIFLLTLNRTGHYLSYNNVSGAIQMKKTKLTGIQGSLKV